MNKVDREAAIERLKRLVKDYRDGWDESSVGIPPVTVEDILRAVEELK